MKQKRLLAGVLAGAMTISAVMLHMPDTASAAEYQIGININLNGEKKPISPYIYGVNDTTGAIKNVKVNAVRQGGNRTTAYNWETNYSSAGEDWMNSSDTYMGDLGNGAGYAVRQFSETAAKYSIPYKLTTLQMAGYVAADKLGTVTESETAPSARWLPVYAEKGSAFSLEPDLTDNAVYMDEYVNYIVQTLGDAGSETGMQAYSLDNEPALWNDTHPRMHPEEMTNAELVSKSIALANAVKKVDPEAEIFGPAFWGMLPCIQAGEGTGFTDPDWQAVKGQYDWYVEYYLQQMKDAEAQYGKRLLDVLDVHYYAQDCATDESRLQAARSLYDPDYVENSWLQPWNGAHFPFLTRLQESIGKIYPGTKLAVSEYNLADIGNERTTGKSVVSAIAETEALGAFAQNDVFFATYWGTLAECPYVCSAINLYTNYDGNGAAFGDTLVETSSDDLSKAAAFAAIDGSDDSRVTLVVSNKDMQQTQQAQIKVDGAGKAYKSASVYAITQDSSDIQLIDVQNDLSGDTVQVELPPMSVAQVVLSTENAEEQPEQPQLRTETVTYDYDSLEVNANGYKEFPLGDTAHLKKIILNTSVTSSSGSSYGGGGGGLCFNHVVAQGDTKEQWASKAYGFGMGDAENIVEFDDQFTIVTDAAEGTTEVVSGVSHDETAEIQEWWKYSEKEKDGSDLTVVYKSVQLVYEYEENGETGTTTQTTTTQETTTTTQETTTTTQETTTTGETTTATVTQTQTEPGSSTVPTPPDPDRLIGDVNLSGDIDITDAVLLNKVNADVVKLIPQGEAWMNADCNQDNELSGNDAIILLKFITGTIKVLPYLE